MDAFYFFQGHCMIKKRKPQFRKNIISFKTLNTHNDTLDCLSLFPDIVNKFFDFIDI